MSAEAGELQKSLRGELRNPGYTCPSAPTTAPAGFSEKDIATLDRSSAHTIGFSIDFNTAFTSSSTTQRPGSSGSVSDATITGANYYGVVADGANVDVTDSTIDRIGETPLNGSQHGVGVLYTTLHQDGGTTPTPASGTLSGTTITNYQKNGVVVSGTGASATITGNTVTGQGPIDYIAQNGIEIASGASAVVKDNTVSGNWYTPKDVVACGLLFVDAGGVKQSGNTLTANEIDVCNVGRGGGNTKG